MHQPYIENIEKQNRIAAFNKLSQAVWLKFFKPSNKYRKLCTKELELMYEAIHQGKELHDAYEYAISVYKMKEE